MSRTEMKPAEARHESTTTEIAPKLLGDLTGLVEKLHGATFDQAETPTPSAPLPSDPNIRIDELLGQIDQGVRDDDATNFEKLQIARRTGPLLLELKELVPHGTFKDMLKQRYPKQTYSKLNRWMYLARHEAEIEEAIRAHPDVSWGPKKMIDYIRGMWVPGEDEEDDEEDAAGIVESPPEDAEDGKDRVENDDESADAPEPDATLPFPSGAVNPVPASAIESQQPGTAAGASLQTAPPPGGSVPSGQTAGAVVQAVPTPPKKARRKERTRPPVNRTEYEVVVRLGFKLSVPDNITADDIQAALRDIPHWDVSIKTPFDYEMSDKGLVMGHVRPWLDGIEPHPVPGMEVAQA